MCVHFCVIPVTFVDFTLPQEQPAEMPLPLWNLRKYRCGYGTYGNIGGSIVLLLETERTIGRKLLIDQVLNALVNADCLDRLVEGSKDLGRCMIQRMNLVLPARGIVIHL